MGIISFQPVYQGVPLEVARVGGRRGSLRSVLKHHVVPTSSGMPSGHLTQDMRYYIQGLAWILDYEAAAGGLEPLYLQAEKLQIPCIIYGADQTGNETNDKDLRERIK
jgi:hypothetical protein